MRSRKKWTDEEIALIRAIILNNVEHTEMIKFLSLHLERSEGSIYLKLARERMTMGLNPKYAGKSIGYKAHPKISI